MWIEKLAQRRKRNTKERQRRTRTEELSRKEARRKRKWEKLYRRKEKNNRKESEGKKIDTRVPDSKYNTGKKNTEVGREIWRN